LALSAATSSITRVCSVCGTTYLHGTAHQCAQGGTRSPDGDDLLGAVLGERYRIVSCLSKGGMGVVYKAQHTVLGKPLALKIMLQPQDEGARQRFMQEAKLASLVHHPNIVDIVDFGVLSSQQPYLVMELLVGQTLADAIYQGPITPARTCYIAAQVARGLHAVHEKGIIHRDLKPANFTSEEKQSAILPNRGQELGLPTQSAAEGLAVRVPNLLRVAALAQDERAYPFTLSKRSASKSGFSTARARETFGRGTMPLWSNSPGRSGQAGRSNTGHYC